jgi:hypothetical protein
MNDERGTITHRLPKWRDVFVPTLDRLVAES